MSTQNPKNDTGYNIFIKNEIYPDAASIFKFCLEQIDDIIDKCIIVIDTNALLIPYQTSPSSLDEIHATYKNLVERKQIIIPGQVAREFANQRAEILAKLYKQLNDKKSNITTLEKKKYPLLETLSEYKKVMTLEEEFRNWRQNYQKAMDAVIEQVKMWVWDDPVSKMYSSLFGDEQVLDLPVNQDLEHELERRKVHNIPPGYKDSTKFDKGIGDLLIWFSILEIGKTYKQHVVFVSGDIKSDWYHKSDKQPLYPRYELVDEFRRNSDGKSFHIVEFSKFLELFGVSNEVVEDVRTTELRIKFSEFESEEIAEGLIDELVDMFINQDEFIIGKMAMTNAYLWGLDVYELQSVSYDEVNNQIIFDADISLTGEQDTDKPFCGNEITLNVSAHASEIHGKWKIQKYEINNLESNF